MLPKFVLDIFLPPVGVESSFGVYGIGDEHARDGIEGHRTVMPYHVEQQAQHARKAAIVSYGIMLQTSVPMMIDMALADLGVAYVTRDVVASHLALGQPNPMLADWLRRARACDRGPECRVVSGASRRALGQRAFR